jgi:hypothetical protein
MGIFRNIFKKKEIRHNFNDDDRVKAEEMKKIRYEKRRVLEEIEIEKAKFELEKAKLELEEKRAELYDLYSDDDEEEEKGINPETMLMTLLTNSMLKNQNNSGLNQNLNNFMPETIKKEEIELSDEEIDKILANFDKKVIKKATLLSDETLKKIILSNMPNLSNNTLEKALRKLRS